MKIAITSVGPELSSEVDPRFGRARYFIVYDTDTDEYEVVDNSENANAMSGAGPQSAKVIANRGVKVVLTGNVGPNAQASLEIAGIDVRTGVSGTVKEVIEQFKSQMK